MAKKKAERAENQEKRERRENQGPIKQRTGAPTPIKRKRSQGKKQKGPRKKKFGRGTKDLPASRGGTEPEKGKIHERGSHKQRKARESKNELSRKKKEKNKQKR